MLPTWDAQRLLDKLPVNVALIGARKMGKSCATVDLLMTCRKKFELVIAMVGTPSCQPALAKLMQNNWDSRFFFNTWDTRLVKRLMDQQEALRDHGCHRHVAILVDDVVLTSDAAEQISHLAMRGRHWLISLFMCGVSWSTLPKRVRRSLDICMVFSCPMSSDVKLLCGEYATNSQMAEFMMKQLEEHQCLVLETVTRRQKLYVWRARFWTEQALEMRRSQAGDLYKTEAASDSPSRIDGTGRSPGTVSLPDRTGAKETAHSVS